MGTFAHQSKPSQQVQSPSSTTQSPAYSPHQRVPSNGPVQSGLGNQGTLRLLRYGSPGVQRKLVVNRPGDRYEQEADRVAGQIMRMSAPEVSARPPQIQRMSGAHNKPDAPESTSATESVVRSLDSSGEPLHAAARSFFEPRFGRSFWQVRVHTDAAAAASAQDLDALAYTKGRHIVFAPGQFEPHSERGRRLLAHELTHVVQQGWGGEERIQRSYLVHQPDVTATRELPRPGVTIVEEEKGTPEIQRQPPQNQGSGATTASPTITFTPGASLLRGETLTAAVSFTPVAGEKLNVTGWRYKTAAGEIVDRPKRDPKFQTEWKGVMALSGDMELEYTVKPRGGTAAAGTPIVSAVTVNDRTGPDWQTTVTESTEAALARANSPPQLSRELGSHVVPGDLDPAAGQTKIPNGPNKGFTYANMMQDRKYRSDPFIHPDLLNPRSRFMQFHTSSGILSFTPTGGTPRRIPPAEFSNLRAVGNSFAFDVPDWTAFCKKHNAYTVTASANGRDVVLQNDWWKFDPNREGAGPTATNAAAIRRALGIRDKDGFSLAATPNGGFQGTPLMPAAKIPDATRSHEYRHATHSHRANFRKIVRALDPRRIIEKTVSTPANPVTYATKISTLMSEIQKPDHNLVDEAASKAAEAFVAVPGKTMAAVNQNPSTNAFLGELWDLTNDRKLG